MEISQYTQTLDAEDITNGYVTVTTTVSRESLLGFSAGIYDVTTNIFYGGHGEAAYSGTGYLTNGFGATNYARFTLGDQVAASDVLKLVIWHLA